MGASTGRACTLLGQIGNGLQDHLKIESEKVRERSARIGPLHASAFCTVGPPKYFRIYSLSINGVEMGPTALLQCAKKLFRPAICSSKPKKLFKWKRVSFHVVTKCRTVCQKWIHWQMDLAHGTFVRGRRKKNSIASFTASLFNFQPEMMPKGCCQEWVRWARQRPPFPGHRCHPFLPPRLWRSGLEPTHDWILSPDTCEQKQG